MRTTFAASAAALLLATAANAAISISDNGAAYNTAGQVFNTAATGDGTFTTSGGPGDQLFKNAWYYRQQNNNQNRIFSSLDTPVEVSSGNAATATYTNAGAGTAGFERFNARFELNIVCLGTNSARVVTKLTFSANAANTSTRTFQVFNLVDFDLGTVSSSTNDVTLLGNSTYPNSIYKYTEASSSNYAEHAGYGATRYQTSTGSSLRSLLGSGSNNLNLATSAAAADNASAFQWSLTLAPGQSQVIWASFSINASSVPTPGSLALLGVGGLVAGRRRRA